MRVVNASPLIHLARVSLLEWLRGPGQDDEVIVPAVVLDEVLRGAGHDPSAGLVEAAARDWLTVVPTPEPHSDINPARIDDGEIAVLSVALVTPGSTVVLDDRAARAEAARLGIPKTGTLRLLLEAKDLGIITSIRTPLELLRARGMRLSDDVWREVLSLAGE
jgi:predicted nucleic acid-binding protein